MPNYFYDTYAIIAYLQGNKRYKKYFKEPIGITTKLNLMEVYYSLLDEGEDYANEVYSSFSSVVVEITDGQIKNAMKKRKELKGKKLNISYVDAIGYTVALDRKIKFLTGDKAFEALPNVEFVK